jgi:hypothetical protein
MPVVNVHRYVAASIINTGYAQELNVFVLSGYIDFEFGTGPVWTAGTWVFLTYATADASVTQANLDTYASVVPPVGFTAGAPQLDTVNKRVTITLT